MSTPEPPAPTPSATTCPNPHCHNGRVGALTCAVCKGEVMRETSHTPARHITLDALDEPYMGPVGKHGPYGTHTNLDGSPVPPASAPAATAGTEPVHNHGPSEGPGLSCRERLIDGRIVGDCQRASKRCVCGHLAARHGRVCYECPCAEFRAADPTLYDTMETEEGEFHWRDGLTFTRLGDGDVGIRRWRQATTGGRWTVEVVALIPPNEWDSIVREVESRPAAPTGEEAELARLLDDYAAAVYGSADDSFPTSDAEVAAERRDVEAFFSRQATELAALRARVEELEGACAILRSSYSDRCRELEEADARAALAPHQTTGDEHG